MYGFRVTKYDPSRRDARGAFLDPDWTSHSDIGKVFGGKKLEIDEYLRVESAYAAAARAFFQDAGCPALAVVDLESNDVQPSTVALGLANLIPLELRLGIVAGAYTPRVARILTKAVALMPEAEAEDLLDEVGVAKVSKSTLRCTASHGRSRAATSLVERSSRRPFVRAIRSPSRRRRCRSRSTA